MSTPTITMMGRTQDMDEAARGLVALKFLESDAAAWHAVKYIRGVFLRWGWKEPGAAPRSGLVTEETAGVVESERLEAMAATSPEVLAADVGVSLKAAAESIEAARSALDADMGVPDVLRYGPVVTLTPEELRKRYPRKP